MGPHNKEINKEKYAYGKNYYFQDIQKKRPQTLVHIFIIFSEDWYLQVALEECFLYYIFVKERFTSLEDGRKRENAIEIIPQFECMVGVFALQAETYKDIKLNSNPSVIVPIEKGGIRIGKALSDFIGVESVPMQMAHTDNDNNWLEKAICINPPDIDRILVYGKTKDVYFAEGVVETEETILAAIGVINRLIDERRRLDKWNYEYPNYQVRSVISKIAGLPRIPDLKYPIWVTPDLWVEGLGVDNSDSGRERNSVFGVIAPSAKEMPPLPYYRTTPLYENYYASAILNLRRDKILL